MWAAAAAPSGGPPGRAKRGLHGEADPSRGSSVPFTSCLRTLCTTVQTRHPLWRRAVLFATELHRATGALGLQGVNLSRVGMGQARISSATAGLTMRSRSGSMCIGLKFEKIWKGDSSSLRDEEDPGPDSAGLSSCSVSLDRAHVCAQAASSSSFLCQGVAKPATRGTIPKSRGPLKDRIGLLCAEVRKEVSRSVHRKSQLFDDLCGGWGGFSQGNG